MKNKIIELCDTIIDNVLGEDEFINGGTQNFIVIGSYCNRCIALAKECKNMVKKSNKLINQELVDIKEELALTEKLLEEQYRIMNAIPECPVHGNRCIPHAEEWIKRIKTLANIINRD